MKKKKRSIAKFSGFKNEAMPIEFSEETLSEMREKLNKKYEGIRIDFSEKIQRIDNFLKEKYNIIPSAENFAVWFYDRQKIGQKVHEVTDEELIKFTLEYREYLNQICETLEKNTHSEVNEDEAKSFEDIFSGNDWDKYLIKLTTCKPALLEKRDGKFKFVANAKTNRGCVAQYFKYLKLRGVISSSINRDVLARVLQAEIENFSISGSTIDNSSAVYEKVYKKQLEKIS